MNFGALIIGDEILSGKRTDQHFAKIAGFRDWALLLSAWLQPVRPVRPVMAPMEARAAQPSMWRRVAQLHWGW